MGVYSLSQAQPLKVGNFDQRFANFGRKQHLSDWKFVAATQGLTNALPVPVPGVPAPPAAPEAPLFPQPQNAPPLPPTAPVEPAEPPAPPPSQEPEPAEEPAPEETPAPQPEPATGSGR